MAEKSAIFYLYFWYNIRNMLHEKINKKIIYYLTNNLFYSIMLLQQKKSNIQQQTTKGEINMFMNEKELFAYRINKVKEVVSMTALAFASIISIMMMIVAF